jgi:hypothetical protein
MGFLARLTTYAAGVVPRIKAADLNGIQDAIVELILGSITVKQLHVDGTGNAASSVSAGDIKASGAVRPQRSGFGTTLPTGTLAIDEHTKGYTRTATFTIATPGDPPTFGGGDAVYAMEYLSTGLYRITWDLVLTQLANNIACHANYHGSGYVANVILTDSSGTGGRFRTQIGILNAAHNLEDAVGRISVSVDPR